MIILFIMLAVGHLIASYLIMVFDKIPPKGAIAANYLFTAILCASIVRLLWVAESATG